MRAVLRRALETLGFDVRDASDGVDALRVLAEAAPPDVVLVDWNMPRMDGLELVGQIRQDARYDTARVVMVTSETELSRVTCALAAGANEYIMKPFGADVLGEKLAILGVV
ncbi:MAG: response regulator [Myxococcales bacterium]|nr:response regulator [Myxococcales bacterium]